jgi:hypothetical protein
MLRTPTGLTPISSSAVTPAATNTASIDSRPSLLQYTSRRCRMSANSSSTSAVPKPNSTAAPDRESTEYSGAASSATPPTAMSTTPKTMWCTWTAPAMTFPGHHRTRARMSRADRRMNPNPSTKVMKKQNSGNRPVRRICAANQPDIDESLPGAPPLPESGHCGRHHQVLPTREPAC